MQKPNRTLLNGSVINDVQLKLYCSYYDGSQIYIAESDSYWSESSVIWNTKPTQGYEYGFFYNVTGIGYQQITHYKLTNLVKDWVNGTEGNYGIYLYGGNNGDNITFYSSEYSSSSYRPKLIVTYTRPALPDLIVTSLSPDPSPVNNTFSVGDSVSWGATIKNNSGGPAGSSEVGYYLGNSPDDLSTPLSPDPTDSVDALSVGESVSESSVYCFTSSDVGQRYLICLADNDDEVDETQEENNKWVYGPFNVVLPKVSTPIISPNGGTFTSSTQVTLSCSPSDATIRYTTNGSTPTSSSTLYTGAFTVSSSCTVKALGFKSGYTDSDVAPASFTINPTPKVATPSISPNGGTFTSSQQMTLSCSTSSAEIRYTTNESTPTSSSTLYTGPFTVSSSCTVKACGFKSGYTDSDVASASFTINPTPKVATPIISPNGGTFTSLPTITLSCSTQDTTIRYTIDGSTPTSTSTQYTEALTIISSTYTIRARGFKSGYTDSDTASAIFTITSEEIPELSVIPDSRTVPANSGTTTFTVDNTYYTWLKRDK